MQLQYQRHRRRLACTGRETARLLKEITAMDHIVKTLSRRPSLMLGGVVLLGVLEFVALQRSQRQRRRRKALPQEAAAA